MYKKSLELIVAALLVVGAWFYAGHKAVSDYKAEQEVVQARATAEQQARYDTLAKEYETLKLKRSESARTITKEVERIIEKPSYDGDCLDSDGLQWANKAIRGGDISITPSAVQADSGSSEHK